ncbi:ABC transporter ATP-binding protein [Actinomyces sp. HMSC06A08]|uniref:ABC transporter ATP-binding protein n=2 Tax=Winkia neuii TaxID=33007 RepID=A0A2I1IQZ9_9ACTO|nr:ABC transporter ATP-binding protein [Winkia neuii]OFJ72220.1 ABC transporter ATP-binding protein [Actinomyces sp. HMSC064C12]OFK02089.1 ABC transporter ATP-binding protein [Actinomyces sp. HMSC072A03]OFT54682.1 ABC transporter ATP-binding protein [Actinomyces sp. HMSC06A08]PKY73553.1 ABC transporter ATP-binding protein [Winkia neuii]
MDSGKYVLRAHDLSVKYGKYEALHLDSLKIADTAGVVGLFGPNGAGKSTLLRTIVSDIEKHGGTLNGPSRENIAYLPDSPFLYGWLKVSQCKELFASRHGDFRAEIFDAFLDGSKVKPNLKVGELSKGMSERLHLALTMSRSPQLYVLDEPLGGVDPVGRDQLLQLVSDLKAPNTPVLFSTHLINNVQHIFNEVVLIDSGRLLAHESAASLRELGGGDLEVAYKKLVQQ